MDNHIPGILEAARQRLSAEQTETWELRLLVLEIVGGVGDERGNGVGDVTEFIDGCECVDFL